MKTVPSGEGWWPWGAGRGSPLGGCQVAPPDVSGKPKAVTTTGPGSAAPADAPPPAPRPPQVLYADGFRRHIQGRAAHVLDTPEMRRVRETQRNVSTVSAGGRGGERGAPGPRTGAHEPRPRR